jgi:hypothetical protein
MLVSRDCSDERDRVYAALGLANDRLGIVPNYNLDMGHILIELSRKTLLSGELSLLHHNNPCCVDTDSTLPSFVPLLKNQTSHEVGEPLGGNHVIRYSAGHSRKSFATLSGSRSISIPGVSIDYIHYTDSFSDVSTDLLVGSGSPFKSQLYEAYERVKSAYASLTTDSPYANTEFRQTFWSTLHVGFHPMLEGLSTQATGIDFRFLDYIHRFNISKSLKGRHFFITESGFMGLGSVSSKQGDKVVIFDRGETPFILRHAGLVDGMDSWRLISDCYVKGWMDGDYCGYKVIHGMSSEAEIYEGKKMLHSESFVLC